MKLKIRVSLMLIISVFLMIINQDKLQAATLTRVQHDDIWLDSLTVGEYRGMTDKFEEYTIDGDVVYCIEPNVKILSNNYYGEIGYVNSPYSYEINKRLQLIGFYGFGYPNHNTIQYKMATQALIWEVIRPQTFNYWTQANGTGDFLDVSYERNEIMRLVNTHYDLPSFALESVDATIGKSITITDTVGTLDRYEIFSSDNITSSIKGNKLILTPNKVGENNIIFRMKNHTNKPTTLFVADNTDSQKMGMFSLDDPIYFKLTLNVSGASLEIVKKDSETNKNEPQGDATLEGAKYELLDEYGTHITYLVTDKEGKAKTDNILATNKIYTLKEVSSSNGYLVDPKEYKVTIGKKLEVTFNVKEEIVKKEVDVIKVYANGNTGVLTPEPNIIFDIYLKSSGEYYKSITTNADGFASVMLPYGIWTFKQKNTTPGYEKVDDFDVEIKDKDGKISKYLSNAPIKAKLKVVKVDSETGKVIKRSGIKFKIFNVDKNEYVCQTITYPIQQEVCVYSTDEEGEFITPYLLEAGNYRLEEIDQLIDGYLWNKESKIFTIDDNSELITDSKYGIIFNMKFENHPVKGKVEIQKTGETFEITDDHFEYSTKSLKGVLFGIYAAEDIVYNDVVVIKKNSKIAEKITDEDGFVSFDNLYLGKYYVQEIATLDNYVLDENKYEVELSYKDQYTPVVIATKPILNILKTGTLDFTKTDISESKGLPNTLIEIFTENDELIFSGRTDETGKVVFKKLPLGKYYILEKEAPEGYKINEEKMYFEVKEDGEIIKTTMKDEDITGTLDFTKIDISTGDPLPNTLIEIYNDKDELVFSGRTDETGKVIIPKIPFGKYYILEKEAPAGYQLNPNKMYFEIKSDGEIIKSIMEDERVIDVPITEKTDYKEVFISGIILMIVATGMIIYGKIKKRK